MALRANPKRSRTEWPLLLAIFLDLIGFSMLIPDIQTRLEGFGASGVVIGLVLASYFVVQILVSPRWGKLSDRIGRKPVLVVSGVLSAISLFAYGLADSTLMVLVSRIFAGFAAANVVVAQAYIADATSDEERTAAMGRVGAATTLGLVVGPAVGGHLANAGGNALVGGVAGCASLLGALWILLALPHVRPTAKREPAKRAPIDLSILRDVPAIRPLFLLSGVAWFSLACLEGTFGRLIKAKLGLGEADFGNIFSYESLLGVFVQAVLLGWLLKRFASRSLLMPAYVFQGVGLGITPFAPNLAALFGASTIYAIGAGVANPTLSSLCSESTPENRQGEMFGLLQAARSFGFVLGPVLGGRMFDWRPESPYILAGVVSVLAGIFLGRHRIRKPEPASEDQVLPN